MRLGVLKIRLPKPPLLDAGAPLGDFRRATASPPPLSNGDPRSNALCDLRELLQLHAAETVGVVEEMVGATTGIGGAFLGLRPWSPGPR